jgi:pyruvate/2-oxoglutarate dehydrogenase complex dihydrolipoamide acyltransferase (E2) component
VVFPPGVLETIVVQPGATVPTGTVLAVIRDAAPTGALPAPAGAPPPAPSPVVPAPPPVAPAPPGRLRISPLARKLAAELGIDPAAVRGTGAGGAIRREDVEQAAAARAAAPAERPRAALERQAR